MVFGNAMNDLAPFYWPHVATVVVKKFFRRDVDVGLLWDGDELNLVFFAVRPIKSWLIFELYIGMEIHAELVDVFL